MPHLKISLLWWEILMLRARISHQLNIPQHWYSKTEKTRHQLSMEFWPLYLLILWSTSIVKSKHFPPTRNIYLVVCWLQCTRRRLKWRSNIKKKMCPLSKKIVLASKYYYNCLNNLLFFLLLKFRPVEMKKLLGQLQVYQKMFTNLVNWLRRLLH